METKTKEQREAARKEARERREGLEESIKLAKEAERAEFMKMLPKRLMDAQALATDVGVTVNVRLIASGPAVSFMRDQGDGYINYTLTYDSDEWEVSCLENQLKELKEKQDAARVRQQLAQDTFNKLSVEERAAIKEFIHYLR
jgi:hypothetical protein